MIQFDSVNTTNTNTHVRLRDLLHEPNSDQLSMLPNPNPNHHDDDNDTPASTSSSSTFEIIHATKVSCMIASDIQQLRQMVQLKRFQPPPLEHPTTKISVTMMIQIHIEQVVAVPNQKRTRTGRSLLQLMDVHEYHSNHHNNNDHHHHPSQNGPHPVLPLALLSGGNHAADPKTDEPPHFHSILMILPESMSATTDEDHRNNNTMTHHSTITLRTRPILLQTARAIQSFSLTHLQQMNSGLRVEKGEKQQEFILNSNNTITELQDEVLRLRRLNTKLQRQCDVYVGPPPKDPNDGEVIERLRTDLLLLQREFQTLQREYRAQNTNYIQLQANYTTLQQQHSHLQYQYNILQYQHHQSIIFTRQLRKFYYRILHKVLCTGTATAVTSSTTSGSTTSGSTTMNRCNDHFHTLIENCSFGAPDLRKLCDIDQYMLDCGLLNHTNEVGHDIKTVETTASEETRMMQCQKEVERIQSIVDAEPQKPTPNNAILLELQPPKSSSIATFVSGESIEQIEVRQKYFQTPGGKCITKQEEVMEVELHKSYEMTFQLHQALVKEQLHVDTLMGTISNDKIEKVFDMMRYQQEIQRYQKIIKDKDYDMKAIIYKMNEIHMISQMYQKQIQEHKTYIQQIEQQYQNTQKLYESSTRQYSSQVQQLHQSYNTVQEQLNVLTRPVWQYDPSQHALTSGSTTPPMSIPIPCRFILPFRPDNTDNKVNINMNDNDDKERYQNEIVLNLQDWMDRVMLSSKATSIPSDDSENDTRLQCHISTQTDDMITGGMFEVAHERLFSEKHSTSISEFLFMDSPISMAPDTNSISTVLPMQPPLFHDTSIHDGPLATSETSAPITSTTNGPSDISSRNSEGSMSDRYTMTSNINPAKVGPMALKFESSPIRPSVSVLVSMPKPITIVETSPQQEPQQTLSPVQLMLTKNIDGMGETVAISNVSPIPKMFGVGNRCTRPVWSPKPESENVKSTAVGIPTDGGFKARYASPTRRDADALQISLPEGLNVDPIVHLERLHDSTDSIIESRDVNSTLEAKVPVNESANGNDEITRLDAIKKQSEDATTSRLASLQLLSIVESSLVDVPAIPGNEALLDSQNQTDGSNVSTMTKAFTIALTEVSNTEALNGSSAARCALPKSVSEMSASQNDRRSPGPKKLSNFLDRLQKQTQRKLESDDKSTTPEFLKAFNKIGSKNKNETVVETSGSAPARDGTRTSFEQLRLQGMNPMSRHKSEVASQVTTKKWTPRKSKTDDDSDSDDSFAKSFMRGAQIAKPTPPPQSSSASPHNPTSVNDDDTSDSDDSFARSFMKNAQVPKSSIPPVNIPCSHTEKGEESDSDESQDERKKVPDNVIPCQPDVASNVVSPCEINTTTPAVESNAKPQFVSKKDDDSDSDSDSSDDSSKIVAKRPTSNEATSTSQRIPMKPMPANSAISHQGEAATKTIASTSYRKDDSDSESDDSPKVIAKKTPPVSATLAKISSISHKNSSDSDDSDDDSSLESKKRLVKTQQVPAATTAAPPITKNNDSDGSDDDSSEEANKTQPAKPIAATTKSPNDDSDDSDDSSTDDKKRPTKPNATADIPFRNNQMAKAVTTRNRNSDTDDSSDDESNMKVKAPEPKDVILSSTSTSLPPRRKVMDSDSDDSDHSSDSTKFGRNIPAPTKATTVARKNSSDDESSSSSSSLPLRNSKAPPPLSAKDTTTRRKDDESSSSSSSDSSESLKRSSTSGPSKQTIEVIDVTNLPDSKSKVPNYTSQIKTGQSESSSSSSSSLSPIATTTRTRNIAIATTSTATSTTITGSTTSAAAPSVKKVKYVVQNGKLVRCDDDDDDPSERDNQSSSKLQVKETKKSKSSKKLEQSQGSLTKSSSRHSTTKSPKTKAVASKTTAAPTFVIVDGKLVKQSPATAAAATETSKTKKKKK